MPDKKRLLTFALKGLEAERARIDDDIAEVRRDLGFEPGERSHERNQASRAMPQAASERVALKRTAARKASKARSGGTRLTAAGRKKLSEAMKRRWAVKKKAAPKKPTS